jgi:hypothetical protein
MRHFQEKWITKFCIKIAIVYIFEDLGAKNLPYRVTKGMTISRGGSKIWGKRGRSALHIQIHGQFQRFFQFQKFHGQFQRFFAPLDPRRISSRGSFCDYGLRWVIYCKPGDTGMITWNERVSLYQFGVKSSTFEILPDKFEMSNNV